jgi:ribosomal protein S18 acetylase RimI-like enzyme
MMSKGSGKRGSFPPWNDLGLSNICMENNDIRTISDAKVLPEKYLMRTTDFNEADMKALAETLDMAFGSQHGDWNVGRVQKELIDEKQVKKTFVIEEIGHGIVACASVRVIPDKYPGKGYMHWVAVHPDHQGQGLAAILSVAVLKEFRDTYGFSGAVLETQDTSLPAIKTYLNAGFRPVFFDESHPGRWKTILTQLGLSFDELCSESSR